MAAAAGAGGAAAAAPAVAMPHMTMRERVKAHRMLKVSKSVHVMAV